MGFGELIKQGLKSAGKAMVKKGSTVSSKKIDDGVVEKVNPYAKTVTIQSKDGKLRETVKADELTVKPVRRRTREESIYIADENYTPKKIGDFSETELAGMKEGEIRQRLIRDPNMQSYADLAKAAPGDSDVMKRVRFIGQNKVPGLRKTSEEKNKFREATNLAKQEKKNQVVRAEQQAKKERAKVAADLEKSLARQKPPTINAPGIDGDTRKLMQAFQKYKDTGSWKRGGAVRASKGVYIEIENRFSDRMLPNKKRTTRIY
tara:strand:+ start:178 stop:963 length:786 start_codon:yes stop_codon:yes gene_type:complete